MHNFWDVTAKQVGKMVLETMYKFMSYNDESRF